MELVDIQFAQARRDEKKRKRAEKEAKQRKQAEAVQLACGRTVHARSKL